MGMAAFRKMVSCVLLLIFPVRCLPPIPVLPCFIRMACLAKRRSCTAVLCNFCR